jgi:hypothetical protein
MPGEKPSLIPSDALLTLRQAARFVYTVLHSHNMSAWVVAVAPLPECLSHKRRMLRADKTTRVGSIE